MTFGTTDGILRRPNITLAWLRRDLTPKRSYFVYGDLTRYLKGAKWVERLDVKDPRVWVMKYRKDDGKTVLAAWSEYTDADPQITFTNAETANPEVSACHLGYGSLQRKFVKGEETGLLVLDLTLKGARPWVLEGDLDNVRVASITKRDFPESKRTIKPAGLAATGSVSALK